MTLNQIELALDSGKLSVRMRNGNFWRIRRNGATKLWKTRPGEFKIPVKAGLKVCDYITHNDTIETYGDGPNLGYVFHAEYAR